MSTLSLPHSKEVDEGEKKGHNLRIAQLILVVVEFQNQLLNDTFITASCLTAL